VKRLNGCSSKKLIKWLKWRREHLVCECAAPQIKIVELQNTWVHSVQQRRSRVIQSQCYTPDAICRWTFSMSSRSSRFCRMWTTAYDDAPTTAIRHSNNQNCRSSTWLNRRQLQQRHTHPLNGRLSGTTRVSRYQKGKTNLDFTEARESEWQWHQLGHMQVCTSLQTDNHISTPPLSFLQAGCPSCRPTNSVEAMKDTYNNAAMSSYSNTSLCSATYVC